MNIRSTTLRNGLVLVHVHMPDTQMVAIDVLYNVGARDEEPEHTGWAHLLEHLMFEGTPRIADYDTQVQSAGGENNAFTNNDITLFYLTVPHANIEKAFILESDRMLGLTLDDRSVEIQKHVVIEEFKQRCTNQPYGDVHHLVRALAYKEHPYRWPTIGITTEHIQKATPDDIRAFYHKHYRPSNAILTVTGAASYDETLRLAKKYFEPIGDEGIPCTHQPTHHGITREPPQPRMRRRTVKRDVPLDMLVMSFHMGGRTDADFFPCDVITDLLANGQSSRLAQRLVNEQKLFVSLDASILGSVDPGLLQVMGRVSPHVSLPEAEAAVWNELDRLKKEDIPEEELEKVRNRYESERVFGYINYLNVAITLPQLILSGSNPDKEISSYRAVTADDIRRTARAILTRRNCSVLYYKASNNQS
ncbi:MAG: insulinase family protein [Bacteroidaceae bacterium]|nr:insulinase family protein [Bacteroidaceae bacterium]